MKFHLQLHVAVQLRYGAWKAKVDMDIENDIILASLKLDIKMEEVGLVGVWLHNPFHPHVSPHLMNCTTE